MGLTHPKGAVTFSLYTNWMLPAVRAEQDARLTDEVRRAVRAELAGEIIALLKTGRTVRTDATGQHASDAVLALLVGTERAWQSDPRAAFFDLAQSPFTLLHPLPADLGYHSPVPRYDGQQAVGAQRTQWREMTTEERTTLHVPAGLKIPFAVPTDTWTPCPWLDGRRCYADGSSLNAEPVFQRLLREGDAGVWQALEEYWQETFGELGADRA